jgi:Raffinose synthase or seed imbibition protein Sip1
MICTRSVSTASLAHDLTHTIDLKLTLEVSVLRVVPGHSMCSFNLLPVSMQGEEEDLKSVVSSLRAIYGVDYIYCWHGLPAYWSGISVEDPGEHTDRMVQALPACTS